MIQREVKMLKHREDKAMGREVIQLQGGWKGERRKKDKRGKEERGDGGRKQRRGRGERKEKREERKGE